jgi:hypothetical protein
MWSRLDWSTCGCGLTPFLGKAIQSLDNKGQEPCCFVKSTSTCQDCCDQEIMTEFHKYLCEGMADNIEAGSEK